MNKIEVNPDFKFSFETNEQLRDAELSGHIDLYDIVRVCVKMDNGNQIDFPLQSREDYINEINRINNDDAIVLAEFYPAEHMFDYYDYL